MRSACLCLLLWLVALGAAWAEVPDTEYFSDDFTGTDRFFYEGELSGNWFSYVDDGYEIDTTGSGTYGQSILLEDLSTYRVQATGNLKETNDPNGGGFGLTLNYTKDGDESDFLLFMVYDRGAFTLVRFLDGKTTQFYPPTRTKLFKPGEDVTLSSELENGSWTCFINGVEVARAKEESLLSGGFGLFTAADCVARFSDFTVYAGETAARGFDWDFESQMPLYTGEWEDALYLQQSGRYIMNTLSTEHIGLSPFPNEAQDFELAFDVELQEGQPLGGFGLFIRDYNNAAGGFNQFRFLVSEDWFAVEESLDDRPLAHSEWRQHQAVKLTGVNRIGVQALAGELVFYVNDVEVWRGRDENPRTGAMGFFVSGGLVVAFDNVEYREL